MLVADHDVGTAAVPLNVMVLVPLVAPKLVPLMVTTVATGPLDGERLVMTGGTITVYGKPLLASPPTVTTTLPVVAPAGTGTTMLLADHDVGVAAVPLKVTRAAAFARAEVAAADGDRRRDGTARWREARQRRRHGDGVGQRVARQSTDGDDDVAGGRARGHGNDDAARGPCRRRRGGAVEGDVLLPLVEPKLLPLMVTAVATGPLDGERLVSVGATDTV